MRATKEKIDENYKKTELHIGDLYTHFSPPYIYIGGWNMGDIEQLSRHEAHILAKYLLDKIAKLHLST